MTHFIGLRRFLMLLCALFLGTAALVSSAEPAAANHVITNCNNDGSGIDEVFFEWNNLVFVGVDLGLGDLLGTESRAVCVVVLGIQENVLVGVTNAPAGFAGRTINVRLCTSPTTCTTILSSTGVYVNLSAPLLSCAYINGVQQLPGCPL